MLGLKLATSVFLPLTVVLAANPSVLAPISWLSNSGSKTSTFENNDASGAISIPDASATLPAISLPLPICSIDACGIDYLSGSLLWWPEATPAQNPLIPSTTVYSGTTLVSPTVYLAYHGGIGLSVENQSVTISIPPLPLPDVSLSGNGGSRTSISIPGVTVSLPTPVPISIPSLSNTITSMPRSSGDSLPTIRSSSFFSQCTIDVQLFAKSGLLGFASDSISQFLVPQTLMNNARIPNDLPALSKHIAPMTYSNLANCSGVKENESFITQTIDGTVALGDRCFPRLVVPKILAAPVKGWDKCGDGLWEIHDPPRPLHPVPINNPAKPSEHPVQPKPTGAKPEQVLSPGTVIPTSSPGAPTGTRAPGSGGSTSGSNGGGSNGSGGGSESSNGNNGEGSGSGSEAGNDGGSNNDDNGSSGSGNSGSSGSSGSSNNGGGGGGGDAGSSAAGGQDADGNQPPPAGGSESPADTIASQDPSEPDATGLQIGSLPFTIMAGPTAPLELIGPSTTITAEGAAMTVGGSTVSLGSSELIVGTQTITAGGAAVTIAGSLVSMGSSVLIIGSRTETFGSASYAMPTVATGEAATTSPNLRNMAIWLLVCGSLWILV